MTKKQKLNSILLDVSRIILNNYALSSMNPDDFMALEDLLLKLQEHYSKED